MATLEGPIPRENREHEIRPPIETIFYTGKDLEGETNALRDAFIDSYQSVFRGSPWNEYQACGDCGQNYSQEQYNQIYGEAKNCQCVICETGNLSDPHAYGKVQERVMAELSHPNPLLQLAGKDLPQPVSSKEKILTRPTGKKNPEVTGFSISFSGKTDFITDYTVERYFPGTIQERKKEVMSDVKTYLGNPKTVSYVSEFGVVKSERRTGLVFDLKKQLTNRILSEGRDEYLCWTSKGILQTEKQKSFGLISPDNVIMAGRFSDLDAIFKQHYQNGDPDKLKKVFRQLVTNRNEKLPHEQRTYDNFSMYPMLIGFNAKPFIV